MQRLQNVKVITVRWLKDGGNVESKPCVPIQIILLLYV